MPIAVVVGDEDVDFDGVGAVTIRDMHVSVQTVLQYVRLPDLSF